MNRPLRALIAAAVLAVAAVPSAHAMFHFTISQDGNDVDILGAGTIDTTGLTATGPVQNGSASIDSNIAFLIVGTPGNADRYTGLSGPTSFGDGGFTFATATSGDTVFLGGVFGSLNLPAGYVSGAALNDSATFANTTLADLGLTPGTSFTYTLGTGAGADSLVVQVDAVPEPSTWVMLGFGALGLLGWTRRRARWA